jgi:hypothetical protein
VDSKCAVLRQSDRREVAAPDAPVDGGDIDAQFVRDLLRRQPQVFFVDVCRHRRMDTPSLPPLPFSEVGHCLRMRHLPIDEARLLPRFRDRGQLERQQADGHRDLNGSEAGIDAVAPRTGRNKGLIGNPADLRGVPVVAPGVPGVAPGSDPLGALLAKERRRGRQLG